MRNSSVTVSGGPLFQRGDFVNVVDGVGVGELWLVRRVHSSTSVTLSRSRFWFLLFRARYIVWRVRSWWRAIQEEMARFVDRPEAGEDLAAGALCYLRDGKVYAL